MQRRQNRDWRQRQNALMRQPNVDLSRRQMLCQL
jgi:hypothetical protein